MQLVGHVHDGVRKLFGGAGRGVGEDVHRVKPAVEEVDQRGNFRTVRPLKAKLEPQRGLLDGGIGIGNGRWRGLQRSIGIR